MIGGGVLIWAELADGIVTGASFELLALGRRVADGLGRPLCAVVLGPHAQAQAEALITRGADLVYVINGSGLTEFHTDAATLALAAAAAEALPDLFLLPHSDYGSELAPRLAFRLSSAPAMGCIDGRVKDGRLLLTRPCYGGRAQAVVSFRVAPAIATLRPKTQEALAADPARHGEVIMLDHQTPTNSLRTRVIERRRNEEQGVRLDEAEIVVSGGRGLGGPDGFVVLEELACVLGGAVGASRPACDLGWYPQKHQVGISGKTVAPELYIAVGISGAGHHMAGCGRSKVLVAINNDPDAEVFSYAHIGIVADYRTLIPEIVDVLRR